MLIIDEDFATEDFPLNQLLLNVVEVDGWVSGAVICRFARVIIGSCLVLFVATLPKIAFIAFVFALPGFLPLCLFPLCSIKSNLRRSPLLQEIGRENNQVGSIFIDDSWIWELFLIRIALAIESTNEAFQYATFLDCLQCFAVLLHFLRIQGHYGSAFHG